MQVTGPGAHNHYALRILTGLMAGPHAPNKVMHVITMIVLILDIVNVEGLGFNSYPGESNSKSIWMVPAVSVARLSALVAPPCIIPPVAVATALRPQRVSRYRKFHIFAGTIDSTLLLLVSSNRTVLSTLPSSLLKFTNSVYGLNVRYFSTIEPLARATIVTVFC